MCSFKFPLAVPDLPCLHQGKTRETYELPNHPELLLMVATDRLNTDAAHHRSIFFKGFVHTALSVFWHERLDHRTHLMAYGGKVYHYLPRGIQCPGDIHFRAIIIRKITMVPIQFIFQGDSFTPKDLLQVPLEASEVMEHYPTAYDLVRQAYKTGRDTALQQGFQIMAGKFEVGNAEGDQVMILGDEILTPDTCHFVETKKTEPDQKSFHLDPETYQKTSLRCQNIFRMLTGTPIMDFQIEHLLHF